VCYCSATVYNSRGAEAWGSICGQSCKQTNGVALANDATEPPEQWQWVTDWEPCAITPCDSRHSHTCIHATGQPLSTTMLYTLQPHCKLAVHLQYYVKLTRKLPSSILRLSKTVNEIKNCDKIIHDISTLKARMQPPTEWTQCLQRFVWLYTTTY